VLSEKRMIEDGQPAVQLVDANPEQGWCCGEPYFNNVGQKNSGIQEVGDPRTILGRQATILAAVPDIIMEVDVNKVYRWANKAGFDFFGDDVIGKEAAFYFEGEQDTYNSVSDIFTGDEDLIHVESWQRRRDGQKRLLAWRCHVLRDPGGKAIGALSSARDITRRKLAEQERLKVLTRQVLLNQLQNDLLGTGDLARKLNLVTERIVDIFDADFCRIWLTGPGDLCEAGCVHASVAEGINACQHKDKCLRLVASSGRYNSINGPAHQRVPFGSHKIGRIASGEEPFPFTDDVANDPGMEDFDWVKGIGLQSFAGFQLHSTGGECTGVLALFRKHAFSTEEQAQLTALSGSVTQVILRAQAEEALKQTTERFRLIAETIDEVFWISDVVEERMLYISPAFERIWGYSRQEMYENRTAFRKALHPDDFARILQALKIQKTGQPYDHEYRIIRPDGSIRQIWDRGFPVSDESGKARIYVGVAQDVTAWRNAEKALKQSTDYLTQIINCIGDPVFVKDRQHRFVLANDASCALIGMKREEMIGKTLESSMSPDLMNLMFEQEDRVFRTGKPEITTDEIQPPTGEHHTVMAHKTLLTAADGRQQLVGVLRDITDLKKAERERAKLESQLRQAQKLEAIALLAGGVAHDFNNLLTVICGNAELLLDNSAEDDPRRGDLEQIRKAGRRAASLTSQLLAFGRKQILNPTILDLNHVITEMGAMLRRLIGEDIELACIAQPGLGRVKADSGQIEQIIMNLAVNARDAMPQGGMLTIETKDVDFDEAGAQLHEDTVAGSYVMLAISDNGIGMDVETKARIFDPFFTTKEIGRGTGLGLSTVYGIVKQSAGFISVYSELEKGTTFEIYFPRIKEGSRESAAEDGGAREKPRGTETVLLVEDEPAVRTLACRVLRRQGYQVLEAADGLEALRMAEEFSGEIQLVLTDVIMPRMSGSELVSRLMAVRPGIKAVYTSGYTDDGIVRNGTLNPNVAFLQKPYTTGALTRKVRDAIHASSQAKGAQV
jgi:PAS domain S-box-containing protein